LIKDAQALELAHRLTIIAFDKTGTLTIGQPQLMQFSNLAHSSSNLTDQQVLSIAMGLQMGSEHPLAKAVIHYGEQQQLTPESFKELVIQPGKGIQGLCSSGQLNGQPLAFISHHGLIEMLAAGDVTKYQQLADQELNQGHSVSWLVVLGTSTVLGMFAFGDQLKPGVAGVIARLQSMNIQTVMISGDNRVVANLIAKQIGIDQVFAEVMPSDKARIIQELKSTSSNACIAMVGDGVNDAPALAAADVGIAMSTGTDIAIHVSGITLMRGDPALVPDAIEISKKTWQKIKQNLFWAFIYNLIGIPLAAMGYLTPVIAGAAMAASSVSVISNALLLKRWARQ
jgi:Cu+-exporting ATPase